MTFNEYQREAIKTKKYPDGPWYPLLALGEEVGELQGKYAKPLRKGVAVDTKEVVKEMGDILWSLSALACELRIDLDFIAYVNLEKLADREKRGVIVGEGDNR